MASLVNVERLIAPGPLSHLHEDGPQLGVGPSPELEQMGVDRGGFRSLAPLVVQFAQPLHRPPELDRVGLVAP